MQSIVLVGADDVARAGHRMQAAAATMQLAASRIEDAFERRRQWEEEYLQRLEAIAAGPLARPLGG